MKISKKINVHIDKIISEQNLKQKTFTIGAAARKKRLELHRTQQEISENICSISYLSKIESNKIIPNDVCVNLLMERMNIPRFEVYLMENSDSLMDALLDAIYRFDYKNLKEMFDEVEEIESNQTADIIKIGYYLFNGELEKAKEIIESNILLLSSMTRKQLTMFTLLSAMCLLTINDFTQANEIASKLIKVEYNKEFNILVNDFLFELFVKEKREVLAGLLYGELLDIYAKNIHVERIKRIKILYMKVLFQNQEYDRVVEFGESENLLKTDSTNSEQKYMMGVSYFKLNKQIQGKEYLEQISIDSKYFNKSLDYLYLCASNREEFIETISKKNEEDPNFYMELFLAKINSSINKELFKTKEYHHALEKADIYEKIEIYSLERDYYKANAKYKDAVLMQDKINELKLISREVKL